MIVFACGLSQSGKSSTLEATDFLVDEIRLIKASDLLKIQGRPIADLSAEDVIINQSVLVEIVQHELKKASTPLLLEGHLLIETIDGPQLVPDGCLKSLPIVGVVFIESSPQEIVRRRQQSNSAISVEDASDLLELEAVHARRFARNRDIEFLRVRSGDRQAVQRFVRELILAQETR